MTDAATPRHAAPRRALHWAVAALVIAMIPAGLIFTDFARKPAIEGLFGAGAFNVFYDLHKSVGFLVLALMLLRLAAARLWPAPAYAAPLPAAAAKAARLSHRAFYALLLATPLLGWAGVSAFPAPLPVFGLFDMPAIAPSNRAVSRVLLDLHGYLALALAALVVVHAAAALWHRSRGDGVFDRMAPRRR